MKILDQKLAKPTLRQKFPAGTTIELTESRFMTIFAP